MNQIVIYKDREINFHKPVYIYRNLTRKGVWYSIKQGGQVKAHALQVHLVDCEFIVNINSRDKVRVTGKKFPHAYVKGTINTAQYHLDLIPERIIYNPKVNNWFISELTGENIYYSPIVMCGPNGVYIYGPV